MQIYSGKDFVQRSGEELISEISKLSQIRKSNRKEAVVRIEISHVHKPKVWIKKYLWIYAFPYSSPNTWDVARIEKSVRKHVPLISEGF